MTEIDLRNRLAAVADQLDVSTFRAYAGLVAREHRAKAAELRAVRGKSSKADALEAEALVVLSTAEVEVDEEECLAA